MEFKIISNFSQYVFIISFPLSSVFFLLQRNNASTTTYRRLSRTIVSLSGQYLALATRLRQAAAATNCARGGVSPSYLWLRLVSCKKRRQWRELASSHIHTSYRLYHQRLMARKARRGCRRRGVAALCHQGDYIAARRETSSHMSGGGGGWATTVTRADDIQPVARVYRSQLSCRAGYIRSFC